MNERAAVILLACAAGVALGAACVARAVKIMRADSRAVGVPDAARRRGGAP